MHDLSISLLFLSRAEKAAVLNAPDSRLSQTKQSLYKTEEKFLCLRFMFFYLLKELVCV